MAAELPSAVEVADEPDHAPIKRGRRLGRYVLCYELASGGMATVYLARAESTGGFGRMVAIKVIHPHLAKRQEFVDMFLDEARLASRIVHPNVCSVFDFGEEAGTYYLAMDYLVGENAGRILRGLARNPELANRTGMSVILSRMIADAAEGLHAAHEVRDDEGQLLELVHRDVTPQNLFVGYDGSVRVVDFGVATALGRAHQTTAGTLKGKYPYMSPEQLRGARIDRRSDVWSLGVCLWEMLTRRRLFLRESELETMMAVAEGPIPPPSELASGVPRAIDRVVMKALARDREARYATAREFGRELSSAIQSSGGANAADVAELMDELFADARLERAALIEKARRIDPEAPSNTSIKPLPMMNSVFGIPSISRVGRVQGSIPLHPKLAKSMLAGTGGALLLALGVVLLTWSAKQREESAPTPPTVVSAPAPLPFSIDAEQAPRPLAPSVERSSIEPPSAPPDPTTLPVDTSAPLAGQRRARRGPRESTTHSNPAATSSPERSPAASSDARGTVAIVTPPGWADVFVDGSRIGRTPMEARLPSGHRTFRLLPYGNEPAIVRSVDVPEGGSTRLVVRLTP